MTPIEINALKLYTLIHGTPVPETHDPFLWIEDNMKTIKDYADPKVLLTMLIDTIKNSNGIVEAVIYSDMIYCFGVEGKPPITIKYAPDFPALLESLQSALIYILEPTIAEYKNES